MGGTEGVVVVGLGDILLSLGTCVLSESTGDCGPPDIIGGGVLLCGLSESERELVGATGATEDESRIF